VRRFDKEPVNLKKVVKRSIYIGGGGLLCLFLLIGGCSSVKTVPAGNVSVATYFGDVVEQAYPQGIHFPVNPLYSWTEYDCREKSYACKTVQVPTKDQQSSSIDFSVQYRLNASACSKAKAEVGAGKDIVGVKLVPNLRSLVRSEGKSVDRCEDLFNEDVQAAMQANLQEALQAKVGDYATITAVLIRNVSLPGHIQNAIRDKKVREQQAEQQKAELARFKTEQEQIVVQAKAKEAAAEAKAAEKRVMADAEAYEIEKINQALASSPAYIQLRGLETLQDMSKNPATQLYFLNGDSPNPLPLMHLGTKVK
jgi:regulator of protease activity HflC (stomatin/prohibitin superfamily)